MKKLLLLFIVVQLCTTAYAQTNPITGHVVEKGSGEVLPGVSVTIKGTQKGTSTDSDGKFSLSIPTTGDVVLIFQFLGYKNQEIKVGNKTQFKIALESDAVQLSEIVAIGYATVNKRDLTGSVSSVNTKQIKDIPVNSTSEALTGRLAGVQITTSEGSPNSTAQIKIRGGGSITQDNSPLYIVDGMQVENALNVLSPQDIESVDVLKDASSTAIYGARGANGVVIITTKGGKEMKTKVNYNGIYGFRQLANELDVMNPYDFVLYQYDRSRGNSVNETSFNDNYGPFNELSKYKSVPFVNWQQEVFGRNANMQTHNVSLAGGTAVTQYSLSLSSNKEEGVMMSSDVNRKLVNFRFDHKINSKLKTGFNVRYNNTQVNGAGTASEGSSSVNRLRHSVKYLPMFLNGQSLNTYDPDYALETNANGLALVNPILLSDAEYRKNTSSIANLNGYFSYDINKYISFKTTMGFDLTNVKENSFNDSITTVSRLNGSSQPIASINSINRNTFNISNVLNFSMAKSNGSFSKRNTLDLLIGQETYDNNYRQYYLENRLFPLGITAERALGNMSLGTTPPGVTTSTDLTDRLVSAFTRVNYSLDKKYLLSFTLRADGSSKFAQGNKWGLFPSGSLAWRVSDESFMEKIRPIVNDLKLRASMGRSGNNRIANFLYMMQFNPNVFYSINNKLITAYSPAGLSYPDLKWETTTSRNLGLDLGLWNNRLQLNVDYYHNSTQDLLVNVPIPTTSGYTSQIQNVGSTLNKGVEFQLSAGIIQNKNFNWTSTFNISFNKNKIVSLGPNQTSFLFNSGWAGSNSIADFAVIKDQSVGTIWGLETDGFYKLDDFDYSNGIYTLKTGVPTNQSITSLSPQPGTIKFKDLTGDGIVNIDDRKVIGNTSPKFFGGFNQQFTYRNLDLSIFVNFQYGNKILNANKLEFSSGYTTESNLLSIMNNRWRNVDDQGTVVTAPELLAALNANATLWAPLTTASSFYPHSWAVEDGSFLRINNITLGYSLPAKLLNKVKIDKLRFYATVNNVAVFTNYSGYDPEVNTRRSSPLTPGVDYSAYPRSRAFITGVNLTF